MIRWHLRWRVSGRESSRGDEAMDGETTTFSSENETSEDKKDKYIIDF